MKHRFKVIERASGYEVEDTFTKQTHWLSDGVDALTTRTGKIMKPGSEWFRRQWQRALNESESETLEAYFHYTEDEFCLTHDCTLPCASCADNK